MGFTVDQLTDLLSGLTRKGGLATMLADLGGDVFDEQAPPLHHEHFIDDLGSGHCVAADLALKHDYLRVLKSCHALGSGS